MAYQTITNRRIPYHVDGTAGYVGHSTEGRNTLSAAHLAELNDEDEVYISQYWQFSVQNNIPNFELTLVFPEKRDISHIFGTARQANSTGNLSLRSSLGVASVTYSTDTTNGLDGTWSSATLTPATAPLATDAWRARFFAITGASGVYGIRVKFSVVSGVDVYVSPFVFHLYGAKTSGQTVDDLVFLNPENSDAEYTADPDFGDQPLGTTVYKQFKVKNVSTTKQANTISLDAVGSATFSTSLSGPWVSTYALGNLAANTSSSTFYVKYALANPPGTTGPEATYIKATPASWT